MHCQTIGEVFFHGGTIQVTFSPCLSLQVICVLKMVQLELLLADFLLKAVWSSATMGDGALCVALDGMNLMLLLCVESLGTTHLVSLLIIK